MTPLPLHALTKYSKTKNNAIGYALKAARHCVQASTDYSDRGDIMKRLLLLVLVASLVVGAAALSGFQKPGLGELRIQPEERNPWTHLRLNNGPATFRFA